MVKIFIVILIFLMFLNQTENKLKIEIKDIQFKQLNYWSIESLQGDLKTLFKDNYKKLKSSLISKGLFVPFIVWDDNGKYFFLDGTARCKVFAEENVTFTKDGIETSLVPCIVIKADNLLDAKEKLLIVSSQYHTITKSGFDEFVADIDFSFLENTVNFDEISDYVSNILKEPEQLIGEEKQLPSVIRITFKTDKDLKAAEFEVKNLITKYEGSYYSVSSGEI